MHPDRKIGIAMGILLIGVVAALFFRNEPLSDEQGLSDRREQQLNQRLKNRDVAVYLESNADHSIEPELSEPHWTLSELFEQARQADDVPLPIGVREESARPLPGSVVARQSAEPLPFSPPKTNPPDDADSTNIDAIPPSTDESLHEILVGGAPTENGSSPIQKPDDFEEYTVRFGDTLSEISERFLGSQTRYRELYELNRDRIDNPDRLKVGKAIRVPRVLR